MPEETTLEILKISIDNPELKIDTIIDLYFEIKNKLRDQWLVQFRKPPLYNIASEIMPLELSEEKND